MNTYSPVTILAGGSLVVLALLGAIFWGGSLSTRVLNPVSSAYGQYVAPAKLTVGQRTVITWKINVGQPAYPSVKIELCRSRFFGQRCTTLVPETPNDGSASIVVPKVASGSAALRLTPRRQIRGQLLSRLSIAANVSIVASSPSASRPQPAGGGESGSSDGGGGGGGSGGGSSDGGGGSGGDTQGSAPQVSGSAQFIVPTNGSVVDAGVDLDVRVQLSEGMPGQLTCQQWLLDGRPLTGADWVGGQSPDLSDGPCP